MARLEYIDAAGQTQSVYLGPQHPRVTVGRNPESDISTTNPSVSRNHGELVLRAGLYLLQDLDSSNGTMLNGQEIRPLKLVVLQHDDLVTCGEFQLHFYDDDQEEYPSEDSAPAMIPVAPAPLPVQAAVELPPRRRAAPPPEDDDPPPRRRSNTPEPVAAAYPAAEAAPASFVGADLDSDPFVSDGRAGRRPRLRPPELDSVAPVAPVLPVAPLAVPATLAVDSAELLALRARVAELEEAVGYYEAQGAGDVAGIEAERQRLEVQLEQQTIALEDAQASVGDLTQRVGELEGKIRRQEVDIENHLEKQIDLRGQIAHQAEQVTELRRELNDRDHQLEDLQVEVGQSKARQEQLSAGASGKDREVNNLKAELAQKSRMIDELQRQLDITSYDLQQAQEHLAHVTTEFSGTGGEVDVLKRKIGDLKDVISVKDQQLSDKEDELREATEELEILREEDRGGTSAKIGQMRSELDRLRQENESLRGELERAQAAGAAGAGGGGRDQLAQLNQLKRDNRELRRQVEELEAQLASGGGGAGGGGADPALVKSLQTQLEDLENENQLLQERIAKLSRRSAPPEAAPAGDSDAVRELKADNRKLRQQLEELSATASRAPASAASNGLGRDSVDSLKELYEKFTALSAKVTGDMDTAAFSASELKRLVELLERVDLSGLEARDRRKLEVLLRDVNPRETLDTMEQMMNSSLEAAKGARTDLRKMRELLEV